MLTWRRAQIALFCVSVLQAACGTARRGDGTQEGAVRPPPAPAARAALYAADEALADALSGDLQHVGTGSWPGNNRMYACAFRNQRVLVVNAYCGVSETPAIRLDVYSPERGRARIYAESSGPVSTQQRPQYFTFTVESEPVPTATAGLPALALSMSFEQLRAYESTRYEAALPACYGGLERGQERAGCLGSLAPHAGAWRARNGDFLERASDDWYRLVHALRALSARHGKEPR